MNTTQKLENAIKNQSDRYIVMRDRTGKLLEVQDKDSGFFFKKVKGGWIWID